MTCLGYGLTRYEVVRAVGGYILYPVDPPLVSSTDDHMRNCEMRKKFTELYTPDMKNK